MSRNKDIEVVQEKSRLTAKVNRYEIKQEVYTRIFKEIDKHIQKELHIGEESLIDIKRDMNRELNEFNKQIKKVEEKLDGYIETANKIHRVQTRLDIRMGEIETNKIPERKAFDKVFKILLETLQDLEYEKHYEKSLKEIKE